MLIHAALYGILTVIIDSLVGSDLFKQSWLSIVVREEQIRAHDDTVALSRENGDGFHRVGFMRNTSKESNSKYL